MTNDGGQCAKGGKIRMARLSLVRIRAIRLYHDKASSCSNAIADGVLFIYIGRDQSRFLWVPGSGPRSLKR